MKSYLVCSKGNEGLEAGKHWAFVEGHSPADAVDAATNDDVPHGQRFLVIDRTESVMHEVLAKVTLEVVKT